ncbi:C4-dicarboxylate ABC transporter [uncultured Nitrosomonas sp.]|uniref:C4-dicarboxylate ABC transporter n=1 Tax=uncultured Nitrosomonas sp. TaxID=156424 RepID=UPI0025EFF711|nr:C4-dicarboxylate ABC transporter [uncultured Nitrosomonas sp.]
MKTSHIIILSALVISGTFFGVLSLYELPGIVMEWTISDVILAAYANYLVIAMAHGTLKTKEHHSTETILA